MILTIDHIQQTNHGVSADGFRVIEVYIFCRSPYAEQRYLVTVTRDKVAVAAVAAAGDLQPDVDVAHVLVDTQLVNAARRLHNMGGA